MAKGFEYIYVTKNCIALLPVSYGRTQNKPKIFIFG